MDELIKELTDKLEGIEGVDVSDELAKIVTAFNAVSTEKEKVNAKNKELLGKQKELKVKLAETDDIKEDYDRLKAEEEERLNNPQSTNEDVQVELEKQKEKLERKAQAEIDKLKDEISGREEVINKQNAEINGSKIKSTISQMLANGTPVMEEHATLLQGYFANNAKVIVDDDGERQVVMKDAYGNAPDYIKDENGFIKANDYFEFWKGSPMAKPYLQAPLTNGGGAKANKGQTKTYNKLSEVPLSERFKLAPSDYERLKKADPNY